jgi:hypothetical protein
LSSQLTMLAEVFRKCGRNTRNTCISIVRPEITVERRKLRSFSFCYVEWLSLVCRINFSNELVFIVYCIKNSERILYLERGSVKKFANIPLCTLNLVRTINVHLYYPELSFFFFLYLVVSSTDFSHLKFVWCKSKLLTLSIFLKDRLYGLVVRVPGYRSDVPNLILGATRLSEKYWVWNGVHSASWVQLRSYLKEKAAAPV